jgi:curved DNA-binding protein CbpA
MFITLSDTLYQEIGVSSGASAAEIKRAYRVKAKRAHPDSGGNSDEFTRLGRAYRVLSDPVWRLAYDRTGRVDDATSDTRSIALEMIGIRTSGDQVLHQRRQTIRSNASSTAAATS